MIYNYARVNSAGQAINSNSLESQEKALKAAGATKIFKEVYTRTKMERKELDKLEAKVQSGDTIVVTKLDHIARSLVGGYELIDSWIEKGIRVNVLNLGVMDNTPASRAMRGMFLVFAQFEHDMIVERTREGKKIASQRPDYREGRKPTEYDRNLFDILHEQVEKHLLTITNAAKQLGMTRQTWYRIAKQRKAG
jgi:DNA invertase Pin-like site-specific DNA recombinase